MSEREKLAERIAAAPLYNARELSARELYRVDNESVGSREQKVFLVAEESRDLIITALCSPDLPSEELQMEVARVLAYEDWPCATEAERRAWMNTPEAIERHRRRAIAVLSLLRTRSPSDEGKTQKDDLGCA